MRLKKLLRSLMTMVALTTLCGFPTASAYVLEVSQQSDGYYHGVHTDGNEFVCNIYEEYTYDEYGNYVPTGYVRASINELKPSNPNVELPDQVKVVATDNDNILNSVFDLEIISTDYYDSWEYGLNLVVPASYKTIRLNYFPIAKMWFKGMTPPQLVDCYNIGNFMVVPLNAISSYREKVSKNEDGWNSNMMVFPEDYESRQPVTVNVAVAGNLHSELASVMEAAQLCYDEVYNLVVTGNINGRDMNELDNLSYLFSLDLSGTTGLEVMRNCGNKRLLETVKLPDSIVEIDNYAFQNCRSLTSINLDSVTKIGSYAFSLCLNLKSVAGVKVEYIGGNAFESCYSLEKVEFPSIKRIDWQAFYYSGLKEFDIYDGVDYSDDMLRNAYVEKLYFHTNRNFRDVRNLSYLTDVYLYDPIPGNMVRDDSEPKIQRLHVPGFAYDQFIDNPDYYGFINVVKLDDNLDMLKVYGNLTIANNESLGSAFDAVLEGGALTNNCTSNLSLDDFSQYFSEYYDWSDNRYYPSTTFINNGPMTTDKVKVIMDMNRNGNGRDGWHFISLPYDVNIKDIITPEEALWVVREYDGSIRANRSNTGGNSETQSAWVTVSGNSVLKGGKGYILHFSSNNGSQFTFPAANGGSKYFASETVNVPLTEYPSEYAHNANWNFIGNPYPALFDSRQIEYGAPITVWNSNNQTYEAFSLVDDTYVLNPFEGFFVQATGANTVMKFHPEGRYHTYEEASAKRNAPGRVVASNQDRSIIDINITGESGGDRTRLVINEEASAEYEISCDASKFMSTQPEVPQIFMLEQDQRLAIDERPMGVGVFPMGAQFGEEGIYTISSQSRNSEYTVTLIDAETGSETDITEEEYTFFAKKGAYNGRFSIKLVADQNAVAGVSDGVCEWALNSGILSVSAKGTISVYSIDGKLVATGSDTLETQLPGGVFVIKAGGKVMKVTH